MKVLILLLGLLLLLSITTASSHTVEYQVVYSVSDEQGNLLRIYPNGYMCAFYADGGVECFEHHMDIEYLVIPS